MKYTKPRNTLMDHTVETIALFLITDLVMCCNIFEGSNKNKEQSSSPADCG